MTNTRAERRMRPAPGKLRTSCIQHRPGSWPAARCLCSCCGNCLVTGYISPARGASEESWAGARAGREARMDQTKRSISPTTPAGPSRCVWQLAARAGAAAAGLRWPCSGGERRAIISGDGCCRQALRSGRHSHSGRVQPGRAGRLLRRRASLALVVSGWQVSY